MKSLPLLAVAAMLLAGGAAVAAERPSFDELLLSLTSGSLGGLIRPQLYPCWNVPAGARDAKELSVRVRAVLNRDGTAQSATIVEPGRVSDPLIRAAAESARRTFFDPRCAPLKLPADKYEIWKVIDVAFDPRELL